MIAAVKVRGSVDVRDNIRKTLETLNLKKKHQVVVFEESDAVLGMMNKAKDYITYGEISDEVLEALEERAGKELESGDTVNLTPPSGGFKSTKKHVQQGGALGKRSNMDKIILKMV